jgi:hypothetical protein
MVPTYPSDAPCRRLDLFRRLRHLATAGMKSAGANEERPDAYS